MPAGRISVAAIICAAGRSGRMGGIKKEYLSMPSNEGLTVLGAAVKSFAASPQITSIAVTIPPDPEGGESAAMAAIPPEILSDKKRPVIFVPGGASRRASVHNALMLLEQYSPSHVLIHDGARPWVSKDLIERIIKTVLCRDAVIPVVPFVETPKELSVFPLPPYAGTETAFIKRHLRRSCLGAAQTPQAFAFRQILAAHEKARQKEEAEGFEYTDDAEVWGEFIGQVAAIPGDSENRKITFIEDIMAGGQAAEPQDGTPKKTARRIGLGRDLHRLAPGRKFLLGGVEIPFEKGELGHSDGDVLAHAVIDAFLGAAGTGDIGELFPPSDPAWKDADSITLLESAWNTVKKSGWRLVNLDCTVSCEKPKILPYRDDIRRSLSKALGVSADSVFVKGKTGEGLGPLGTGEAVEAFAVCLLEKDES